MFKGSHGLAFAKYNKYLQCNNYLENLFDFCILVSFFTHFTYLSIIVTLLNTVNALHFLQSFSYTFSDFFHRVLYRHAPVCPHQLTFGAKCTSTTKTLGETFIFRPKVIHDAITIAYALSYKTTLSLNVQWSKQHKQVQPLQNTCYVSVCSVFAEFSVVLQHKRKK